MKIHELKSLPAYFDEVWQGHKKFEVRINDRDFNVGDILKLREYDTDSIQPIYTGREIIALVTYRMPGGRLGVADDYCVMSIEIIASYAVPQPIVAA